MRRARATDFRSSRGTCSWSFQDWCCSTWTPEEAETVDVEVEDPELRRGTEDPDRWSSGVTDYGEIVTLAG